MFWIAVILIVGMGIGHDVLRDRNKRIIKERELSLKEQELHNEQLRLEVEKTKLEAATRYQQYLEYEEERKEQA
ncbi:hypothetical protein FLK61_25025 [Paenalkalicoccus suaedae]|uniref:Uncharacterized protein n=1 Tax=Paenalkalicoccus suaedae TaxID=2592382 RepID=A0A859FA26_9BACI|nr:hypothetical protein [Paenalkalicoccus suaedae]QKS70039.1 hypothetical protein FLK61_25025 [Paenalkalicoccus suaedae]